MRTQLFRRVAVTVIFVGSLISLVRAAEDVEVLVTEGDTLIHICEKYLDEPSDWPQVAAINQLDNPHWIFPGQKLVIPAELLSGIPSEGKITFIKGTAELRTNEGGGWVPLRIAEFVRQGSIVRTGSDSALEVTLENGGTLFLKSDTTVGLEKLRKRGGEYFFQELFLESGRVFSRIKKVLGRDPGYRIRTPATIAAARGTEFRVSHDGKSKTRLEVLKGRVAAGGGRRGVQLNEGEGTVVEVGKGPATAVKLLPPPTLINPESLYRKMPLEFRFDRVAGALAYRVMLGTDPELKDVVFERLIRPHELLAVQPLHDGGYHLQVQSIDSLGLEGVPSEPHTVRVRTNPVPPFVQLPLGGAEYKTVTMEFAWLQVEDAAKYQMEIAQDPDFLKVVDEREFTRKTGYKTKSLLPGTYYFRIRSVAADNHVGIWSDVIRFSLLEPPPAPPADPPRKGRKEISIRWKDLGEGYTYHFQMAQDRDFQEVLMDTRVERSQHTFPKPRKPGAYFVRVSAVGADGFEGHFSSPQSFQVGCFEW